MGMASILLLFLLFTAPRADAASCVATDSSILLAFKSMVTSDSQGVLASWKPGTDCCRGWAGVVCDKRIGKVTKLSLQSKGLYGTIHGSVGSLTNLTSLDLSANNFTGKIPSKFSASLVSLDLDNNQLSGPIPDSITTLSKLKLLDLGYNYGLIGNVPSSIGRMTSLFRLRLQSNKLTGPLPASLGLLSNLVYAEFQDNSLSGKIPDGINRKMTSLSLLDLSGNSFTELPADLSNLKRLSIVYLQNNKVDLSFESINGLATLPSLGELHLDKAGLAGQLPRWLVTLNLQQSDDFHNSELSLSGNSITGPIPTEIGVLQNVQVLNLDHNKLSGSIPATIGNLTGLQFLALNDNRLSGSIPASLLLLDQLQGFNVSNNLVTGQIPQGGSFASLDASSFAGNPGLCGSPLPLCSSKN